MNYILRSFFDQSFYYIKFLTTTFAVVEGMSYEN